MTAHLTLVRFPLGGAQDGFTITVTAAHAHAGAQDAAARQSTTYRRHIENYIRAGNTTLS